jgi:Zn-dependent protease
MTRVQRVVLVALVAVGVYVLVRNGVKASTVVEILAFAAAVILHEVSHGVVALAFGDDTAKKAGRITLNPVSHIDPFGTVILPAMLAFSTGGGVVFGYAKPVPVNPRRMRDPRNHQVLVSLAGPATNIALAVAAGLALRWLPLSGSEDDLLSVFVGAFGFYNVILAVFNLIPIPPLDGSALIERVLPARLWEPYLQLRQYSILLLFVVAFWLPTERLFIPAIRLWARLFSGI